MLPMARPDQHQAAATLIAAAAATLIAAADAVIVCAGAGMSADSGLPVYYGPDGAYAQAAGGIEQASAALWETDPVTAWAQADDWLTAVATTPPHRGYDILTAWRDRAPHGGIAYTSNTDGHLPATGWTTFEAHGSTWTWQCTTCPAPLVHLRLDGPPDPPRTCTHCGNLMRPNTLMFADFHYRDDHRATQWDTLATWFDTLPHDATPVIVEIGVGTTVPIIRTKATALAAAHHWPLIRINPEPTPWPTGVPGTHIHDTALNALTLIHKALPPRITPAS